MIPLETIDRNSSNIIKGILICLIVIGHNYILTETVPGLFVYLYSFHVYGFFILPWFYFSNGFRLSRTVRRSAKLLLYYLIFFVLLVIAYHYLYGGGNNISFPKLIYAFVHGGHHHLDAVTGYQYLWFLPAFMFSMLFYDIINSLDFKWNRRLAIFSFAVYFIFIFLPYTKEGAIVQGCYFAATGMLAVIIYNIFHNYISLRLTFVLFIIGSILMTIPLASSFSIPLMPFIAFFFLWEISKRYKRYLYVFETLGKISLWIYLIHPLVYQVLIRLIPPLKPNILYGCVILIITIPVSVFVANIINSFFDMIRIARYKINTPNANN